jgi:hypothetical protein
MTTRSFAAFIRGGDTMIRIDPHFIRKVKKSKRMCAIRAVQRLFFTLAAAAQIASSLPIPASRCLVASKPIRRLVK